MWRLVETYDDARDWLEIADLADPSSYSFTKDEDEWAMRAKQILQYYEDKPGAYEYWIYDNGKELAALCAKETIKDKEPYLEYITYCSTGFGPDAFSNWAAAYPITCSKCREIKDRRGILRSGGWVPMTEAGKCIVYHAETLAWEQDKLSITPLGDTWRVEFYRDPAKKPADEALFEVVKEATIIPDTKPK